MSGVTVGRGQGKDDGAVLLGIGDAVEILGPVEAVLLARQLLDAAGLGESRRDLTDEDFDVLLAFITAARAGDKAGAELVVKSAPWPGIVFAAAWTVATAIDVANVARLASFGADLTDDDLRAEWPGVLRKVLALARGRAAGLLEG